MRPRSLRAIVLLYVLLVLAALFAVGTLSYATATAGLQREVDRRLAAEASEIAGPNGQIPLSIVRAHVARGDDDHDSAAVLFMLLDPAGKQLAGKLRLGHPPPLGYFDFGNATGVAGSGHGRAVARRIASGATLIVISDNAAMDGFNAGLLRVQLIGFGFTASIVIIGAVWVVWEVRRRLRAMRKTFEAVMGGDLGSRIPLDGSGSAFEHQAQAINRMLDRLEGQMSNLKHAAKDVTHELKTPLGRLRAKLGAVAWHARGGPLAAEIDEALAEADLALETFGSLMRLWEIEGGSRRERFVDLDLADLVREVGESLRPVAEDAGQTLRLTVSVAIPLNGERNLLRQLLLNLVENAIRHCPKGTQIALSAAAPGVQARLMVVDDGPGIPAAEHARAIRRFGRIAYAGGPVAPGLGLGLTLVDAIARLHGGTLMLENAGPGLRVIVDLPRET